MSRKKKKYRTPSPALLPKATPTLVAPPENQGFRVLILEDGNDPEPLIAEAVSAELPEARITLTRTAMEARALARATRFDLVILDALLPADLGRELLDAIQTNSPKAEVVVTTSESWIGGSHIMDGDGPAMHMLMAPMNPLELIEIVRTCWERADVPAASEPANPHEGQFVVVLSRLTPVDVIQLKCLAMATSALDFIRPNGPGGRIWLEKGEIIHAETGLLVGEQAFYEMVNWPSGSIVEVEPSVRPTATIALNWQSLLMHAMHEADERRARAAAAVAN